MGDNHPTTLIIYFLFLLGCSAFWEPHSEKKINLSMMLLKRASKGHRAAAARTNAHAWILAAIEAMLPSSP